MTAQAVERAPGPGWIRLGYVATAHGTLWGRPDGLRVISSLVVADLPDGSGPGPQWHVSVSAVGVGIASLPKARHSRDGFTFEISRIATDGYLNACSRLYGALCRAAAAVGYRKAITFTRLDEPGISLRAAGFVDDGVTKEESWDRLGRPRSKERSQVRRWVRHLVEPRSPRVAARRRAGNPARRAA